MNPELKRFFDSINFYDEEFNSASLNRVVFKKSEDTFFVYIKVPNVCPIDVVNKLFLCSKNGINGDKKCQVILEYKNITDEDIKIYFEYLLDNAILKRPSLVSVKNSTIDILDNTVNISVTNNLEKEDLESEIKNINKELKKYGFNEVSVNVSINEEEHNNILEEIKKDKENVTVKKEVNNNVIGTHKDGEVSKLNNIYGELKNVIVEVYVFDKETVERQGKKGPIYIMNAKVSDKTDSKNYQKLFDTYLKYYSNEHYIV